MVHDKTETFPQIALIRMYIYVKRLFYIGVDVCMITMSRGHN